MNKPRFIRFIEGERVRLLRGAVPALVLALDADATVLPPATAGEAWPPAPLAGWTLAARLTLTIIDGPENAGYFAVQQRARTSDEAEHVFGWLEDVDAAHGALVLASPDERLPDELVLDAQALYGRRGMCGGFVVSADAKMSDMEAAIAADGRGDPEGAYSLGVLLYERGGLEGAEAAYRRADEGGHPGGSCNLGLVLYERGDLEGAEAAYRRADERGDDSASNNLGVILEERRDVEGAEAAWRRADERGHPNGAYNLGVLLEERGDLEDAEGPYMRADERGHASAAFNLGLLLHRRGDVEGAEAALRRAEGRGHSNGGYCLGRLLQLQGDLEGAEAAYRRAEARGHPDSAYNLGKLLEERGDLQGAVAAWRRAVDSSDQEIAALARQALKEADE